MNFQVEFGLLTSIAVNLHIKQTRNGAPDNDGFRVPYIIHPLQVLQLVQRWGITNLSELNKSFFKGILFHDSIEDTICTYEYLIGLIGKEASNIALELTKLPDEDKVDYMASFATKSIEAVVAKVADRICNTEDFIKDIPDYSYKYLCKADPVFKTLYDRKSEVVDRFGEATFEKIDAYCDLIHIETEKFCVKRERKK